MANKVTLDAADLRILSALQEDATLSVAALADIVNLSHNACWRRMKRLEELKVVKRRVALLDARALGMNVTVFVTVRASEHSEEWLNTFATAVRQIPEVLEFYRMSGEVDYLLKLQVESIEAYDEVYKRLIKAAKLIDVSSAFAMEELKHTTALPMPDLNRR